MVQLVRRIKCAAGWHKEDKGPYSFLVFCRYCHILFKDARKRALFDPYFTIGNIGRHGRALPVPFVDKLLWYLYIPLYRSEPSIEPFYPKYSPKLCNHGGITVGIGGTNYWLSFNWWKFPASLFRCRGSRRYRPYWMKK